MKKKLALAVTTVTIAGSLAASGALAAPSDTRPGWGHGDTNHVHVGPPGQSVNPGDFHHMIWWWIWNFLRHFHFPWGN